MRSLIKPAVLAALTLLLLIPLAMIEDKVRERSNYRDAVRTDIAQSWTGAQTVKGPWLVVAYRRTVEKVHWDEKSRQKVTTPWTQYEKLLLRPKQLKLAAALDVSHRRRGIFQVPVFVGEVSLSGLFDTKVVSDLLALTEGKITLDRVYTAIGVTDARGIASSPIINWAGARVVAVPGTESTGFESKSIAGFHAELPKTIIEKPGEFSFQTQFTLHGIDQFLAAPVAFDNQINLTSNWPHPSFTGDFLPLEHAINDNGFQAAWSVSSFAAGISLAPEIAGQNAIFTSLQNLNRIGVRLFEPVDIYTLSDRATKYGLLFVLLTFSAFFLFEILGKSSLHPLQYGMVGLALAIFFLLLLSLSEQIGFTLAYSIATVACVGLITLYIRPAVGTANVLILSFGLLLLYAACYVILMLEDHALLVGSGLLFIVLAAIMLLTKRIDWYQITPEVRLPRKPKPAPATIIGE